MLALQHFYRDANHSSTGREYVCNDTNYYPEYKLFEKTSFVLATLNETFSFDDVDCRGCDTSPKSRFFALGFL